MTTNNPAPPATTCTKCGGKQFVRVDKSEVPCLACSPSPVTAPPATSDERCPSNCLDCAQKIPVCSECSEHYYPDDVPSVGVCAECAGEVIVTLRAQLAAAQARVAEEQAKSAAMARVADSEKADRVEMRRLLDRERAAHNETALRLRRGLDEEKAAHEATAREYDDKTARLEDALRTLDNARAECAAQYRARKDTEARADRAEAALASATTRAEALGRLLRRVPTEYHRAVADAMSETSKLQSRRGSEAVRAFEREIDDALAAAPSLPAASTVQGVSNSGANSAQGETQPTREELIAAVRFMVAECQQGNWYDARDRGLQVLGLATAPPTSTAKGGDE